MLGTYVSFALALALSSVVGQAVIAACGRRAPSPLAPAVGLAAVCALAWGAVGLPGEGTAVVVALGLVGAASAVYLASRVDGAGEALRLWLPIAALALLAASLPFIVEGRFGILGTGLNPDMSQHLFAADRLADGDSERLLSEGYPLGPHALVVGLAALGPSTIEAFGGLTLAVAVAACLAPLALLADLSIGRRYAGALAIGFAYLVAAYLVQGALKETLQALFVLAFAIGLHELARGWPGRAAAPRLLRAVPLAVLAIGSVYVYSSPGLAWLVGALGVWAAIELGRAARAGGLAAARRLARLAAPTAAVAALVFAAAVAPEIGRLVRFGEFETFDPAGAGLGNLFDRLSPLEALGVWPSGDFRVEPGDGFAPAIAFYLGAALALFALLAGLHWWLRRGDRAVPAALGAAVLLWLYALVGGTPYQEAKALALAAPLVALVGVRGLLVGAPLPLAATYLAAAAGSAALALANGPVGPADYSPELRELAPKLGEGSTLVLADEELLDDEHGRDYLVWELRGNRICVEAESPAFAPTRASADGAAREGYARILFVEDAGGDHAVFEPRTTPPGPGPCPLISDGARADPGADD